MQGLPLVQAHGMKRPATLESSGHPAAFSPPPPLRSPPHLLSQVRAAEAKAEEAAARAEQGAAFGFRGVWTSGSLRLQ